GQALSQQVPNKKNASQGLTDWHCTSVAFVLGEALHLRREATATLQRSVVSSYYFFDSCLRLIDKRWRHI
ncbi:hypothetical protein, partial [Simplicispira piscis]